MHCARQNSTVAYNPAAHVRWIEELGYHLLLEEQGDGRQTLVLESVFTPRCRATVTAEHIPAPDAAAGGTPDMTILCAYLSSLGRCTQAVPQTPCGPASKPTGQAVSHTRPLSLVAAEANDAVTPAQLHPLKHMRQHLQAIAREATDRPESGR